MEGVKNNQRPTIYVWRTKIHVLGHLDDWIRDYFDVLTLNHEDDGYTHLTGELPDLAAVYGLILILRDTGLNVHYLLVERCPRD